MKIKNKHFYFIQVLLLTIILIRIITYIKDPDIIIRGFELHHFYYGILLLIVAGLITLFKKKINLFNLALYAISTGLIIDELEYIIRGFEEIKQYTATIPSVIFLTTLIILITIYIKHKK